MDTATFDTHQAVKAITGSGLDDTQAETIVTTIHKAMHQGLATKSDIVTLKTDAVTLKSDMKEVKSDIVALKADVVTLKSDMKEVKSDIIALKADVVTLKSDMKEVKSDIVALKAGMESVKANLLVLQWMVGLVIAVEVIPFLKFFT